MMPTCCLSSFAWKGIEERFALAKPGETHTCPTCGRVYRLLLRGLERQYVWTEVVPPLKIEDERP